MKALPIILVALGIYALFHVTVQSIRHAFILWVDPRGSALAKYEQTEQEIVAAKSLEELVAHYEAAREKVKQWEQGKSDKEKQEASSYYSLQEPYKSQEKLRKAVQTWESQHREIYQLHFYWWCGLVILLAGLAGCVWVNRWLGVAWLIVAFAEMIWWTSPSFNVLSAQEEFDRLVRWKFIYSMSILALLLALWYWLGNYLAGLRGAYK